MVKLEHYSSLTSKHEDLLENKYCLKHPLVIKLKPKCINDFFLGAKSSLKPGQLPGMTTNIKYSGIKDLKLNTKIDSKGKLSLKAETTSERFKNAKIISQLGLLKNQVSSASITFDFQIPDKLKSRIKLSDGPALEVQSTLAILDITGVSFSSTLDLSSHTIDQINLGLWYKKDKTDIVLKHESKSLQLQNLSLALYHQIKHLKLGGQLLINMQKDQGGLSGEVGFQYKMKEKLNSRAKIDLEGVLSAGIDSVMGENCKISLTTQVSKSFSILCYNINYQAHGNGELLSSWQHEQFNILNLLKIIKEISFQTFFFNKTNKVSQCLNQLNFQLQNLNEDIIFFYLEDQLNFKLTQLKIQISILKAFNQVLRQFKRMTYFSQQASTKLLKVHIIQDKSDQEIGKLLKWKDQQLNRFKL